MLNSDLQYVITEGKNKGKTLTPHVHKDGQIVVSKTRFKKDYVKVAPTEFLLPWLEKGFRVRMSAPGVAPSLISPPSIKGWR
jgi:hypothetical protein